MINKTTVKNQIVKWKQKNQMNQILINKNQKRIKNKIKKFKTLLKLKKMRKMKVFKIMMEKIYQKIKMTMMKYMI